ncbi:PREDICTED: T-cell activation Rho GTPase-activating protein isoform X1 [Gavialis gangeticus]|uniref:T-cell activation Rho GTPase-activating protein isoform X1 n=2 Tax=Gavialis gangeticus TaxID=94835 RepID=UPI00092EA3FA|nr:PREDICTED: T-cell activation Rho GTPase-activating protein isoform X1 [Gavialis gangeticus]
MSGPQWQREVRRGSYDGNTTTKNPFKHLAHHRGSAPSLVFSKALSKPRSSAVRDSQVCAIPIEQCPFVLGLTSEDSELILNECVQLTQSLKTTEKHLFLFSDSLIIAKFKSGTSFRLKHRLKLCDLWVVYSGEEEEEEEEVAHEFSVNLKTSIILIWPTSVCIASFRSLEVKDLWLDTILWQTQEAKGTRISKVPSAKFLMKVLSSCNASKTLNISTMEALIECKSEADIKKCQLLVPYESEDGLCHLIDGNKKRKKVISWPSVLRWSSSISESSESTESDLKISLFGQPLAIICGENDTLPKPIQDILNILYLKGCFTEGIFRKAANEKARKELKEELNSGIEVALESKTVHLLAVVLKDFLRNIPHNLLSSELYDEWMTALEKLSHEDKIEGVKEVADKLPRPNLFLLKHLVLVLHRISQHSKVNKMDASNLAICIGPNMLNPQHNSTLPLEVQKEMNEKVKALVEFLIDNCFEIFGNEISSLLSLSSDDSLECTDSSTELISTTQQNDSAYDSPDPEAECHSSTSQLDLLQQAEGSTGSLSSRELQCHRPRGLLPSAFSIVPFKKLISSTDRRFSEPDMPFEDWPEGRIRSQKLTKSEDNFTTQEEQLVFQEPELEKQLPGHVFPGGQYRNKKPLNLKVKTSFPSDSLPKTSSSGSLDSSLSNSDCSVFTSSPLASPASPKRNVLNRLQSFSTKTPEESSTPNREIRKHSMSFSFATRKRDSFKKDSKKEKQFSYRRVQENCIDDDKPLLAEHQQRLRFRSADEVFREVDQKNPGKPPSYEEATKNCPAAKAPPYSSLTVQTMRLGMSDKDSLTSHPCLNYMEDTTDQKDLLSDRHSMVKDFQAETETIDVAVGINARASLPVTPRVYRLRAMSESYQKNKQEYLIRRCSQPIFDVDQIQYAKESYV